ncbi:MAG: hypothetical protein ACEY3F_08830 [Wolbachia sp.]|nr:hypothetical protein [Wolbachia endosymbiont of Drosophila pseudotakahashii]MCX3064726.1 hypothetical protein [Wolbachia endosymbiont of Drosophila pseudotakahashii]UZE38446.1 hypothetical protein ONI09_06200 [Wolbachia endosymbiont of Drosophila pseudotakahashii]
MTTWIYFFLDSSASVTHIAVRTLFAKEGVIPVLDTGIQESLLVN